MTVHVMAGHSRLKDGVASLAYVPAIPMSVARRCPGNRDGRDKPGHDVDRTAAATMRHQSGLKFIATPLMQ